MAKNKENNFKGKSVCKHCGEAGAHPNTRAEIEKCGDDIAHGRKQKPKATAGAR